VSTLARECVFHPGGIHLKIIPGGAAIFSEKPGNDIFVVSQDFTDDLLLPGRIAENAVCQRLQGISGLPESGYYNQQVFLREHPDDARHSSDLIGGMKDAATKFEYFHHSTRKCLGQK
jgi:hypothetical protein